jgi:beta-glucosidase
MLRSTRLLSAMLLTVTVSLFAFTPADSPSTIDQKVADLLKKMTLEAKVGQMTQIVLEVLSEGGAENTREPHRLDMKRVRQTIVDHQVGSILNYATSAHSVEHWHEIITTIQDVALQETEFKIPVLYGIDAVHGANYTRDATLFPQAIAMAATWNTELMRKSGEITGYELRASGHRWNFYPDLDICRNPVWPRLWETFGEDPYVASVMGVEYIKGLQGDDVSQPVKAAACVKHFLGYGFPLSGKDRTPALIPVNLLHDIFLPPFKAAIAAGAKSLMPNSAQVNGVPVHSSHYYLTKLLREELGFTGLVVSDYRDMYNLYDRDHVAASPKEAVAMSVLAGVDMSMVPLDFGFYTMLIELVREGRVPMSRIDEAVARILKLKFELGLFDNPYPDKTLHQFASVASQQVNLQAAQEAIVLLKNEKNILPLSKDKNILVCGPGADKLAVLNGGWTITWQGDREELYPKNKKTILQAITDKLGRDRVRYVAGADFGKAIDISAAVSAAKQADAVVLCLGEPTYCEQPGNINDLSLPEPQLQLAEALLATGKPVVLVLVEGRPRLVQRIEKSLAGILLAFLPGMEGGPAISDVLFGDVNPSGKLPVTYPRYPNDLTLYDYTYSEAANENVRYHPQWPFGFGKSYTTFSYENLTLDRQTLSQEQSLTVQVTVKNTGKRKGQEVVQLYVSDLYASITPAVKKLKRFSKIALLPNESQTVSFQLNARDLGFSGTDGKLVIEPGEFKITIADLAKNFILQ